MAEGCASVLVHAALRGREHIAAILDGARPDRDVPVRLAGLLGERRRDGDEGGSGFGERSIERREAQVVTDCQAEPAPWQIGRDRAVTGAEAVRLAIAFTAGEVDIEHMDLVVA